MDNAWITREGPAQQQKCTPGYWTFRIEVRMLLVRASHLLSRQVWSQCAEELRKDILRAYFNSHSNHVELLTCGPVVWLWSQCCCVPILWTCRLYLFPRLNCMDSWPRSAFLSITDTIVTVAHVPKTLILRYFKSVIKNKKYVRSNKSGEFWLNQSYTGVFDTSQNL